MNPQPTTHNPQLILLTGAPGWLGTRLLRVLRNGLPDDSRFTAPDPGTRIRCLILPGADVSALRDVPDVEFCVGDVRDMESLRRFCAGADNATLFHCAGIVHPTEGVRQLYRVNHEGTRSLLAAAEAAGVRRAVVVSSNSPIGTNPRRDHLFDETSPYHPYMSYGRSKVLMERAVAEVQARGRLETALIRPPWFYGPDQPPRQTLFFTLIRTGKVPIVGDGNNRRSMAYVDNICQGLMLAAHEPKANGGTYWIADERPYTMNEIVDTIERLLETEFGFPCAHKRLRLPGMAGQIAQAADGLLQAAGLYNQKMHVLSEMNKTIACSVEKARRELGYDPKVALEEGMRRSIRWCLDRGIGL